MNTISCPWGDILIFMGENLEYFFLGVFRVVGDIFSIIRGVLQKKYSIQLSEVNHDFKESWFTLIFGDLLLVCLSR